MEMERRGCVRPFYLTETVKTGGKMNKTKPFIIPKGLVMQAFKLVKGNAGAAGVDQQSIADFEIDLKNNTLQ